jgi:hypothetical protein
VQVQAGSHLTPHTCMNPDSISSAKLGRPLSSPDDCRPLEERMRCAADCTVRLAAVAAARGSPPIRVLPQAAVGAGCAAAAAALLARAAAARCDAAAADAAVWCGVRPRRGAVTERGGDWCPRDESDVWRSLSGRSLPPVACADRCWMRREARVGAAQGSAHQSNGWQAQSTCSAHIRSALACPFFMPKRRRH